MATQSGSQQVAANKLENAISLIKYTLFSLNVITWVIGAVLFATAIWFRVEPGFEDWVTKLELESYYVGIYMLMFVSLVILGVSFLGCAAALTEVYLTLIIYIGAQIVEFLIALVGAAILMNYSTVDSAIQPIIRDVMMRLISQSGQDWSAETLSIIQENIGCCGADGPGDYLSLKQPLPNECRDTVTGNAFFHGCVDELTWYMEGKSIWLCGLALVLCLLCVVNGVLAGVMFEALKKEEREAISPGYGIQSRKYD